MAAVWEFILRIFRSYPSAIMKLQKERQPEVNARLQQYASQEGVSPDEIFENLRNMTIGPRAPYFVSRFDSGKWHYMPAAILGPIWFAWRRMHKAAISSAVGIAVAFQFFFVMQMDADLGGQPPFMAMIFVSLILLATGLSAISTYRAFVYKTVYQSVLQTKTLDQALKRCYALGGTSPAGILLIPLFLFVGLVIGTIVAERFFGIEKQRPTPLADAQRSQPRVPEAPKVTCRLIDVQNEEHIYSNNGMDWGVQTVVLAESLGGSGTFVLKATLTSSEGTFERYVTQDLEQNKPTRIVFDFPEPTIKAENIRASVNCQFSVG